MDSSVKASEFEHYYVKQSVYGKYVGHNTCNFIDNFLKEKVS